MDSKKTIQFTNLKFDHFMSKRLFFLLLCGGMMMHLSAQRIEVSTPRLVSEAGTEVFYPKFTPDGRTILLTSESYNGLKAFNLETGQVRQLSSAVSAGWNPVISADSRTVYFQAADFSGRGSSFHAVNMETGQTRRLESFDNLSVQTPQNTLRARSTAQTPTVVFVNEDLQIVVERNGQQSIIAPHGNDVIYINASLSPDGTRIAFVSFLTNEAHISDLEGNIIANLGTVQAPVWLTNDWVVGMNEVNDGHVITGSHIVAVTTDGRVRQNLTQRGGDLIAMFPAASPDGRRIAFNTLEGNLYIMEISIHN